VSSKKRVYIIDEVHMLSAGAFNALLKTLEEPPGHVLFILATTETHKVPATIVSRCQRFAFRRISPAVLIDRLGVICEAEGIVAGPGALELLAQVADGSFRDALSLLEQCSGSAEGALTEESVRGTLGLTGLERLADWLCEADDLPRSIGYLNELYEAGMDVTAILGQLSSLLRDLLMGQMLNDLSVTRLPAKTAEHISALWPRERILQALSSFTETRLSRSADKKLDAELCLIRLAVSLPEPASPAAPPPKPQTKPQPPPEKPKPQQSPEKPKPQQPEKPEPTAPSGSLTDAERDPRWQELLKTIENPLLRDALTKSGAKVDRDSLIINSSDPFIQGVIKQADKQIAALFPGGRGAAAQNPPRNDALDALVASAGDLIIEE
jgi:DNA polymerase-3 subunit gamma/tau